MAVTGNLPNSNTQNSTQNYFNNFYTQKPSIGPQVNGAVLAYFQSITGDVETGNTLAGAVIYTALQQNLDPMAIVEQLRILSNKNKATSPDYSYETNKDAQDTDVTINNGTSWTTGNVQYAKPGPSTPYNNISELDAYLTMFLNFNRSGTSLLGLNNSPHTSKYIERAILP